MSTLTTTVNSILKGIIVKLYNIHDLDKFYLHKGINYDYQFNQIHALSKLTTVNAKVIGEDICAELMKNNLFESIALAGTDKYISISLNISTKYLEDQINLLYLNPKLSSTSSQPKKIIIDYSSPNIAKEMHVGHLRSTIIGDCLARVFEFNGNSVQRINHVGDWGTQFGMLIAYIKKFNVTNYTISDLMMMYRESKKLFDDDNDFNQKAHLETVNLQQGSVDNIKLWQQICTISQESFNKIYDQLGIHSLEIKGESFYQSRMLDMISSKDFQMVLTNKDGMKLLFVANQETPLVVVKSDGGLTYDTSDLTAVRYRLFEEKADKVIYVVDSGQQLHFQLIFAAANDLGWCKPDQLHHVGFGLVLGPNGKKLKTRSGDTIKLQDLLDESYVYAKKITTQLAKEKHPEWLDKTIDNVSNKIAINCIKYADLATPRLTNYKFSYEKMLNVKGNTGVYLMYAFARCRSILRKVEETTFNHNELISIENPECKQLVLHLIKYDESISDTIDQLSPHYLCDYLYNLCGLLTKFYEKNRCIEFNIDGSISKVNSSRIKIVYLVVMVMDTFFRLIGLEHVEEI